MNPFACAVPIGTTKFLWLIAGPQRDAENDRKFQPSAAGPEDMAIYAAIAKQYNEVTQLKEEKQ